MTRKELRSAAREQIKGNILVCFCVSLVFQLILSALSITGFGALIIAGPLDLGSAMLFLQIMRTKEGDFGTAFKGFNRFGDALVAGLLEALFIILWSLLFIIPGIVAAYSYQMTFYILADNPEMSGLEALKASKKLMKGHKFDLFVLELSFLGWILLSILTCGILFIWVIPYMNLATTNFYESIKDELNTKSEAAE